MQKVIPVKGTRAVYSMFTHSFLGNNCKLNRGTESGTFNFLFKPPSRKMNGDIDQLDAFSLPKRPLIINHISLSEVRYIALTLYEYMQIRMYDKFIRMSLRIERNSNCAVEFNLAVCPRVP